MVQYIADRTGLNRGDVDHILAEFQDGLVFFGQNGQGVTLERMESLLPEMDVEGSLYFVVRMSKEITNRLNLPGAFRGEIINKENIGKTSQQPIELWNRDHPGDPVQP